MKREQREATARAVLSFLERCEELEGLDAVRITVETTRRGLPARRMRYTAAGSTVRTFVRALAGSATSKSGASRRLEQMMTPDDLARLDDHLNEG